MSINEKKEKKEEERKNYKERRKGEREKKKFPLETSVVDSIALVATTELPPQGGVVYM